jgi:hypothetical protein
LALYQTLQNHFAEIGFAFSIRSKSILVITVPLGAQVLRLTLHTSVGWSLLAAKAITEALFGPFTINLIP